MPRKGSDVNKVSYLQIRSFVIVIWPSVLPALVVSRKAKTGNEQAVRQGKRSWFAVNGNEHGQCD